MKPVRFGAANRVYRGPTPEIGDLWCYIPKPGDVRTVWEFNDDERKLIAEGGRIELRILNEPIPPVALAVLPEGLCEPIADHGWKVIPELEDEERCA